MIYAGTGGFLRECRENLESGDHRSALTMLREAVRALVEDYHWTGSQADTGGLDGKIRMLGKRIATGVKTKVGKKLGLDSMGGKARKMAQDAHNAGQAVLHHGHAVAVDATHAINKSIKKGEPHHAEIAAANHGHVIKGHQAVMTKMKRVMDQANKEGDHETADWAAKAGAEHSRQRAFHMDQQAKIHAQRQSGAYSQKRSHPSGSSRRKSKGGSPAPAAPQAPAAAQGGGYGSNPHSGTS